MHFGDILVLVAREPSICNVPESPCGSPSQLTFVVHYCTPGSRSPEFQAYSARSAEFQAYALGQTPSDKTCPALTLSGKECTGFRTGTEKRVVLPL